MAEPHRAQPGRGVYPDEEADRRLEELTRQMLPLEIERARMLARIARSRHYRLTGCSALAEYGRQLGLRPCVTSDLYQAGFLLELRSEAEAWLLGGELSFEAAALLYQVISDPQEEADAWIRLALDQPTAVFRARAEDHLASRRLGGAPVRLLFLVSRQGKETFDRAHREAERRERRLLTEGEALESISAAYLKGEEGPGQSELPVVRDAPTRYIPRAVRTAVRMRDAGMCRVPGCGRQHPLNFSHIVPFRDGGEPTIRNILLLCWTHNQMMEHGFLRIRGTADDPRFFDAFNRPYRAKRLRSPPPPSGWRRERAGGSE